MRKFSPILFTLFLSSIPFETDLFAHVQAQQDDRTLRVLIEGDPATAQVVIHKLNVAGFDRGLSLVLATSPAEPHDIRLILTASWDQVWNLNLSIPATRPQSPVALCYSSAVGLAPDGSLLFTLAASGDSVRAAMIGLANEVSNSLYGNYAALKGYPQPARDASTARNTDAGVQPQPVSSGRSTEPPAEFGVYYGESAKWTRVAAVEPVQTNSSPSASALIGLALGGGLAGGVNVVQVYHGCKALAQIPEGKPLFYLRGIMPSTGEVIFVRLDKKRDSRELRIGHATRFSTQSGPRVQDVTGAIVTGAGRDLFTITPRSELKPGEYLLFLGSPDLSQGGYEFGIAGKAK